MCLLVAIQQLSFAPDGVMYPITKVQYYSSMYSHCTVLLCTHTVLYSYVPTLYCTPTYSHCMIYPIAKVEVFYSCLSMIFSGSIFVYLVGAGTQNMAQHIMPYTDYYTRYTHYTPHTLQVRSTWHNTSCPILTTTLTILTTLPIHCRYAAHGTIHHALY
jgi:hypothetical protein